MKIILNIFLCFFIVSCGSKQEDSVKVQIRYSPILDSICSLFSGGSIKDEWKKELLTKREDLEREWENIGLKLISTAEEITGKNFERRKNNVYLALCNTPSRSSPLILNMRYSLTSFTENPVSTQYKIGTLFHELMHPYINEHLPKSAPSLEEYKNEHSRVLEHIHLLALQKAVYLHLMLNSELSSIIQIDSSLPNGYYKRSWEIVNSSENYYMVLVAELAKP